MAQAVKHPTLDYRSGRDVTIREFEPHIGFCSSSVEPAWDSLPPSLSAPPPLLCSLKNKHEKKFFQEKGCWRRVGKGKVESFFLSLFIFERTSGGGAETPKWALCQEQ